MIPIALYVGYIVAIYVPILAQARYSVPLIPLLSILGATLLLSLRDRRKEIGELFRPDSDVEQKETIVHAVSDVGYVRGSL